LAEASQPQNLTESEGFSMPLTLVLAIGLDALSLGIRISLLQSAGYIVVSAFSIREAANQFLNGDFDLVLLDKSLPAKDRDRITSLIRISGSRIPVVSIASETIASETGRDDFFVDATFDEHPDNLLKGISSVLAKTATSAAAYVSGPRNERKVTLGHGKKPPCSSDTRQYVRQNTTAS
jgi:CheY-like chemotaxis protein